MESVRGQTGILYSFISEAISCSLAFVNARKSVVLAYNLNAICILFAAFLLLNTAWHVVQGLNSK